jgi:hypothetical protein
MSRKHPLSASVTAACSALVAALAAAPAHAQVTVPADVACAFPAPPVVVRDEPSLLLQHWLLPDDPLLGGPSRPASAALHDFRARITASLDVEPRSLLARQLAHTSGGDAENVRLALDGAAGTIREMSCLEALLVAAQSERSLAQGRSMYTHPTEFVSWVLARGDTLKVWYYTVDQPGVRALSTVNDRVAADVAAGWRVLANIHNHNFFPGTERVLGGVVPSAVDVQAMRSARDALGLPRATITNGFHSIDITAAELERFSGPVP